VTIDIQEHTGGQEEAVTAICYGQLEKILVCELPDDPFFGVLRNSTCLLALVTPCNTAGHDATKELTTYSSQAASVITDLRSVVAVVGRVWSHTEWTIIDRSRMTAYAVFEGDNVIDTEEEDD
jgi:hypothetical protein